MLPGKRIREDTPKIIQGPYKIFTKTGKYLILVSRIPENIEIPTHPQCVIFNPRIRNHDAGFCFITSSSLNDHNDIKSKLIRIQDIKIIENIPTKENIKKNIEKSLIDIQNHFKQIILKMFKVSKKIRPRYLASNEVLLELSNICDDLKTFCENILIQHSKEIIKVFGSFCSKEKIDEDLTREQFAIHLLIATSCFLQKKLQPDSICQKKFFLTSFHIDDLFTFFETFSAEKKIYIIDVFYQIAYLSKQFVEEESVYQSIFNLNTVDNSLTLTSDMKPLGNTLKQILNIIGSKYFSKLKPSKYLKIVEKFICSVHVVKMPDSLIGLTLMNSSVLVNSKCLVDHENLQKKGRFPVCDAFIIITCVHEFGHFVQRVEFKKKYEWFSHDSPADIIQSFSEKREIFSDSKSQKTANSDVKENFLYQNSSSRSKRHSNPLKSHSKSPKNLSKRLSSSQKSFKKNLSSPQLSPHSISFSNSKKSLLSSQKRLSDLPKSESGLVKSISSQLRTYPSNPPDIISFRSKNEDSRNHRSLSKSSKKGSDSLSFEKSKEVSLTHRHRSRNSRKSSEKAFSDDFQEVSSQQRRLPRIIKKSKVRPSSKDSIYPRIKKCESLQDLEPSLNEGGGQLITAIFGYEPDILNYYDSIFITNPKNWELSESDFREEFQKQASRPNPKRFKKYFPVRCKQVESIFSVRLGICLSSRRF